MCLKVKAYYERYLQRFKPVMEEETGKVAMTKQPGFDFIRCVCGHSHRWCASPLGEPARIDNLSAVQLKVTTSLTASAVQKKH